MHPLAAAFAGANGGSGLKPAAAMAPKPSGNPLLAAIQGGANPSSQAGVTVQADLTNVQCGFTESGKASPNIVPERIALLTDIATSWPNGASTNIIFACDASSGGQEKVGFTCETDQGLFGFDVSVLFMAGFLSLILIALILKMPKGLPTGVLLQ